MLTTADTSNNNKITANKYSDINQGDDANSNISSEPALLDWDVILDLDMVSSQHFSFLLQFFVTYNPYFVFTLSFS